MRTEWFAGLVVASVSVLVISSAWAQEAQDSGLPSGTASTSPFAALAPLSESQMDELAGGTDVLIVEQGHLMLNDTTAAGTSANNVLSGVNSGALSGNFVSNNNGFTTGVFNSGSGVGIAVNTSVIINLQ